MLENSGYTCRFQQNYRRTCVAYLSQGASSVGEDGSCRVAEEERQHLVFDVDHKSLHTAHAPPSCMLACATKSSVYIIVLKHLFAKYNRLILF